jgi:FKBP-type peptidyl-prolyl cis-trans isomerase 2
LRFLKHRGKVSATLLLKGAFMHKAFRFVLLSIAVLALIGCGAKVADKMVVKIGYTGTLADGSTFDSSEGSEPLEFMVGGGQMIPQFEQNLIGLKKGDKKTFTIAAADAYGARDEAAMQEVPLTSFGDLQLTKGMQLATSNPTTGEQMIVTVSELKKDSAVIDFNHPLAGKDLTFAIEVVDVRKPTKDELSAQDAATAAPVTQ